MRIQELIEKYSMKGKVNGGKSSDRNPSLSLPMGVQASTRGTLVPDIWCKRLLAKAKVRSHHPMV